MLPPSNEGARALAWLTSLQDRNLNAEEIGWPFRLGLQGCIVDRSQDIGWQRTFGHGRKIVPEMLQRRGAAAATAPLAPKLLLKAPPANGL